jgi:hypothetical protein
MPKEKTVRLKAGKAQQISLSYEEQVVIYEALHHTTQSIKKGLIFASLKGPLATLEKQFEEMISK